MKLRNSLGRELELENHGVRGAWGGGQEARCTARGNTRVCCFYGQVSNYRGK